MIHFLDWQCILRLLALLLRFDGLMNMDKINNDYLNDIYMDDTMANIEEFYILGVPIRTDIGILHPVHVKQYPIFVKYLQILNMQDFEFKQIIDSFKDQIPADIYQLIQDVHFFEFLRMTKSLKENGGFFFELFNHYIDLFKFCFKEDVFEQIKTFKEFEEYRDLIRNFNGIKYDKPNPNPIIERQNQLRKFLHESKGDTVTFNAMYTSILVATGNNPNDLTLYQFNKIFDRISQFKNHDTTTLYRILDNKIEIEAWYGEQKEVEQQRISIDKLKEPNLEVDNFLINK